MKAGGRRVTPGVSVGAILGDIGILRVCKPLRPAARAGQFLMLR